MEQDLLDDPVHDGTPVCCLSRRFGFADFESSDALGGGVGHLHQFLVVVLDAEGGVGGFDGQRRSGVANAGGLGAAQS
ncbi:hypothetical protein [Micromonospora peucetia]|uniref:hypothetical protein n=1 Tax=Micromonospora peucetia TaxID=47871 RepID=UPI001C406764|nr:hypothetical protein [Micromonospora peucetia]